MIFIMTARPPVTSQVRSKSKFDEYSLFHYLQRNDTVDVYGTLLRYCSSIVWFFDKLYFCRKHYLRPQ